MSLVTYQCKDGVRLQVAKGTEFEMVAKLLSGSYMRNEDLYHYADGTADDEENEYYEHITNQ